MDGTVAEPVPPESGAPEPAKWPLRKTFAFLLVVGGLFWVVLGVALKIIIG